MVCVEGCWNWISSILFVWRKMTRIVAWRFCLEQKVPSRSGEKFAANKLSNASRPDAKWVEISSRTSMWMCGTENQLLDLDSFAASCVVVALDLEVCWPFRRVDHC